MIRKSTPLTKTVAVTGAALLLGLAAAVVLPELPRSSPGRPTDSFLVTLVRVELLVTTFNLCVLVALTGSYVGLYRDLPNKYTRSLIVLSLALLLYAFTSNPFVPFLFGYPPKPDIGVFVFLPDLFVSLAIVVLFYQSQA